MDDLENYRNDGYHIYRGMFTREEIMEVNEIIDGLNLKPCETVFDEDGTGKIKQIQYLYNYNPVFSRMIEKLRPLAMRLTGQNNLKVLNMQMFEKHPEISKPTRAHQDNAYFRVTPSIAITFWISLDEINEDNGCLYYAPKTHLTPTRKHQRYNPSTTFRLRSGVPGLSLCLHEHPEECDIPILTLPGDVCVHNCNTIHRAGKNNTLDKRRRAIGLVFIPEICKDDERLTGYHNERLREDIELQKYKNPSKYRELREKFNYLYN